MITDVRCSVVGSVPFAPKLRNALAQALHLLMVGVNDPGKRHLVKRNTNIDLVKGSIGSITQVNERQDDGRKAEETEEADQTDGPTAEVKGANEDAVQCEQGNGDIPSEEQTEHPDEAPREEVQEGKEPTNMNAPMPVEPVPAPAPVEHSEVVEPEVTQFDRTRETMEVEIKENMPEKPEEKKCDSLELGKADVEKTEGGIANISDTANTQKGSGLGRFFSQVPKANVMVSANDADVPDRDPILDLLDQTKQIKQPEELGVDQHNENKDNEDEKTPTPMGEKDANEKDKKKDKSDKEKKNKHEKKDKDKDKDKKNKKKADKKDEDADAAVREKGKDKKDKEKKRKASHEDDEDLAAQTALALLSCQVPQNDGEAAAPSSSKALAKTVAKAAAKTLAQQKSKAKAKAKPRAAKAKAKASPTSIKTPKSPKQRRRGGKQGGQHEQDPNKGNLH